MTEEQKRDDQKPDQQALDDESVQELPDREDMSIIKMPMPLPPMEPVGPIENPVPAQ